MFQDAELDGAECRGGMAYRQAHLRELRRLSAELLQAVGLLLRVVGPAAFTRTHTSIRQLRMTGTYRYVRRNAAKKEKHPTNFLSLNFVWRFVECLFFSPSVVRVLQHLLEVCLAPLLLGLRGEVRPAVVWCLPVLEKQVRGLDSDTRTRQQERQERPRTARRMTTTTTTTTRRRRRRRRRRTAAAAANKSGQERQEWQERQEERRRRRRRRRRQQEEEEEKEQQQKQKQKQRQRQQQQQQQQQQQTRPDPPPTSIQ
eukprot:COSAG05_NODE_580_length_8553_cov_197.460934_7_plen_257_part_00